MSTTILKKRMKNMRITVAPNGAVVVSVPKRVTKPQIDQFIDSRKPWIEKMQEKFSKARDLIKLQPGEILLHGEIYTIENNPTYKIYNDIDDERRVIKTSLDLTTQALSCKYS
jgi:predicted metal-dependent hydrolase